jgi:hypothetical protein
MELGVEAGMATETIGVVGAGAEAGMATAGEIGRTGLIVRVFGWFKVEVVSSGKS